jgi:SAM-dependent methyltransferase
MSRINSEKFYKNAIKKYGISAKGVCWINKERQELRFEILHSFLPQNLSDYSLTDAGCGFGDFYHFLTAKNTLPKKYRGIDAVSEMCAIAQEQTQQEIICANILRAKLPQSDYYICSGAMNILTRFETTMFIQKCYAASKKGFIFNVLYGEKESEVYNYLNKKALEGIAKELGVKELLYRDDYLESDITMGFFK